MIVRSLAAVGAVLFVACASGGSTDYSASNDGPGLGDAATGGDVTSAIDSGAVRAGDSGGGNHDSGGDPGVDASSGDDSGGSPPGDDGGGVADTGGGGVVDTGSPPPDSGGTIGDVCPNTTKYQLEAVQAAAGGSPLFCPISASACPSTECCFQQASPLSICVPK